MNPEEDLTDEQFAEECARADAAEKSKADAIKSLVRIKPADYLVAYYNGNESEVEGTIECDSALDAIETQKEIGKDGTKTQIFVSQVVLEKLHLQLMPKDDTTLNL